MKKKESYFEKSKIGLFMIILLFLQPFVYAVNIDMEVVGKRTRIN